MDWLAGLLTLLSLIFAQRRMLLWMNLIGLVAQVPWIILVVQAKLWGLLPLEAVVVGVYAWGLVRRQR